MNCFEYVSAESLEAAVTFLAESPPKHGTLVKAGGIDVIDRLKEGLETPKRLLNLRAMRRRGAAIRADDDNRSLVIDASATLTEVAANEMVKQRFPALAAATGHAATPQIRNVATIAGNLCQKPRCWYFRSHDYDCLKKGGGMCFAVDGDNRYHAIFGAKACHIVHPSNAAVPLMAYKARARTIRHESGKVTRRELPLDELFCVPDDPQNDEHVLEPGELIEAIVLPMDAGGSRSAYVELREKQSFDWPMVSCAVNVNDRAAPRVVLGAVAPIPWRLAEVERIVAGNELNSERIEKAAAAASRDAEPMSGNEYKVRLIGVAVERALTQAAHS